MSNNVQDGKIDVVVSREGSQNLIDIEQKAVRCPLFEW